MSLDMMKSDGTIAAQALKVSHHGRVAARQRKIKRTRSASIGTIVKTQVQSTPALPLRRHSSGR